MRLVFICGCLEHGADGVGDYTRILALQLSTLGHDIFCIAINDQFVDVQNCSANYEFCQSNNQVQVYRFSRKTGWIAKIKKIRKLLKKVQPDWVSLQYVPFSFSPKGIPLKFTALSCLLKGSWKWHIMFHELWVNSAGNMKRKILSESQILLVKAIAKFLRPSTIHTSLHHYVSLLSQIGLEASILPLHSNISVVDCNEPKPIGTESWHFVFFGSFDNQWHEEPLLSLIEAARIGGGIKECIFSKLGRSTAVGREIWERLSSLKTRRLYPSFRFSDCGELSEPELSSHFLHASFGISMAPIQWINKSSSVAAMLEHGLPVIVPVFNTTIDIPPPETFPFAQRLLLVDSQLPLNMQRATKFNTENTVRKNAKTLLALLQE